MQHQPTNTTAARVESGLSNADYHALDSISKSGLDLIRKAPALYKFRRENPQPTTPALRWGTLVHTAILEPHNLADLTIAPKVDRRTAAGKAEWAEFELKSAGREIVTEEELEKLRMTSEAVHAHAAAGKALAMLREVETSIFWTDPDTGINCRCRPDGILNNGLIVDVKTTGDASADEFVKTAAKWRYHVQAAYYSDGYRAAFGEAPKGFAFIAVEKDPPFMVAFYVASEAMTLRGRSDYKADLATFDRCRATDTWPALSDSPIIIDLPKWA